MKPTANATVLAFDFGTQRIGVAVGNTLIRVAQPLVTIAGDADATTMAAIAALVHEWQPGTLVVGVPLHADGTPHAMTARVDRFAREIESRSAFPAPGATSAGRRRVPKLQLIRPGQATEGQLHAPTCGGQL